jgi:hypothetical protein
MKNSDMPAMPQSSTSDGYPCNYTDYGGVGIPTGLTKREMMAMHMMQGLVSAWGQHDVTSSDELASDAVMMADSLLAELERTK